MWGQGVQVKSSVRITYTINYWAFSLAPSFLLLQLHCYWDPGGNLPPDWFIIPTFSGSAVFSIVHSTQPFLNGNIQRTCICPGSHKLFVYRSRSWQARIRKDEMSTWKQGEMSRWGNPVKSPPLWTFPTFRLWKGAWSIVIGRKENQNNNWAILFWKKSCSMV